MTIDDFATQLVEDMSLDAVCNWADTLHVPRFQYFQSKTNWAKDNDELRVAVAEAMANLGRAK